jgi:surface antigen
MNIGLLAFNVVTKGDLKKQAAIVFATMAIVVALPFAAVFAMGESVVTFLSGVPSIAAAESQGFYTGGPVPGDTYAWGNCTYWAFAMRLWAGYPIPTTWGNANTWDDRAIADGYVVNHTPAVGAVYQTDEGTWGHVAYVASVNDQNGEWTISEMNYFGLNIVSKRTFSREAAASYTFIHGKKGATGWNPQPISLP